MRAYGEDIVCALMRIRGSIIDKIRSSDWLPRSLRRKIKEIKLATERLKQQIGRAPTTKEIADVLGDSNYSIDKYLDDANYIINNGTYVPELNGYVSFMSGKKYGFVGLDRTTGDITTFHIKNIYELIKKAPSLGFER